MDGRPVPSMKSSVAVERLSLDDGLLSTSPPGLQIVVSGDGQDALITLKTRSTGEEPREQPGTPISLGSGSDTEALEALFRLDGGELCRDETGVTLRLPSLAQARAEGR